MSTSENPIEKLRTPEIMAQVLVALIQNRITGQSAKKVLQLCLEFSDEHSRDVDTIIKEENLELLKLSVEDYHTMARNLIDANQNMAEKVRKGEFGKLMWFVGQMMREGKGNVEAERAKAVLEELLTISSP